VDGKPPCALAHPRNGIIESARSAAMTLGTLILVILVIMLVASLPTWPHSRSWGYYPSSGVGLLVLVFLFLLLSGRI
jgi:hypothetical protein